MSKPIEVTTTRDAATCPKCRSRNTMELGPPEDDMGEVTWLWECHDCGIAYTVYFDVVRAVYDAEQDEPPVEPPPGTYQTRCASCDAVLVHDDTCSCGCKVTKLFHKGKDGWSEIR